MEGNHLLAISLSALLAGNIVFTKMLGLCSFVRFSKNGAAACGLGLAVTVAMTLGGICSWVLDQYILVPLECTYLRTTVFVVTIAAMVQVVELLLQEHLPNVFSSLGVYLYLAGANCAVLGAVLLSTGARYSLLQTTFFCLCAGLGFLLAIALVAGIRERLEFSNIPPAFRGAPLAFIVAGLVALSFLGFAGLRIG